MILGGFINGKLIFLFRFPFKSKKFSECLLDKLKRRFPKGEDISGELLRSAYFSLRDYKSVKDLDCEVFVSRTELNNYRKHITKPLYSVLVFSVLENKLR